MRQALTLFVNRLWPTDLVAIMDPLTTLSALRFTRSKAEMLAIINKFEGRQSEIFPIKSVMEEVKLMRGDIRRVRAQVTFSALAALTMKLGGMREGRKSIIFVSQGPPTYTGSRDGNLQDEMRTIIEAANLARQTKLSQEGYVALSSLMFRLTAALGKLSRMGKIVIVTALLLESPKWNRELAAAHALKGREFPVNMPGSFDLIGMVEPRTDSEANIVYPARVCFQSADDSFVAKFTGAGTRTQGPLDISKI